MCTSPWTDVPLFLGDYLGVKWLAPESGVSVPARRAGCPWGSRLAHVLTHTWYSPCFTPTHCARGAMKSYWGFNFLFFFLVMVSIFSGARLKPNICSLATCLFQFGAFFTFLLLLFGGKCSLCILNTSQSPDYASPITFPSSCLIFSSSSQCPPKSGCFYLWWDPVYYFLL